MSRALWLVLVGLLALACGRDDAAGPEAEADLRDTPEPAQELAGELLAYGSKAAPRTDSSRNRASAASRRDGPLLEPSKGP